MKIITPKLLKGELALLRSVVDEQANIEHRHRYADWLERESQKARAKVLRSTAEFLGSGKASALSPLPRGVDGQWAQLVAHTALVSLLGHGLARRQCLEWLSLGRPAVSLSWKRTRQEPGAVESKAWGSPDLDPQRPWPTVQECSFPFSKDELEPAATTKFVAQLNFAELVSTVGAEHWPRSGLLSFFSYIEVNRFGTLGVAVRFESAPAKLKRREQPQADELNSASPPHTLELTEYLSFPEGRAGPAKHLSAEARRASPPRAPLFGVGGYLMNTTNAKDMTPAAGWSRLACLPDSPNGSAIFHLAIPEHALESGDVSSAKLVWTDMG